MRRAATALAFSLVVSGVVAPGAQASGWIVIDPIAGGVPVAPTTPLTTTSTSIGRPPGRIPAPRRPLLKGGVTYGLHLKDESVKVVITDQVAKTYISQTFSNDTDRNLAGTYLFPLPEDTTFSSFSLHIDGKPVEGKILEANAARAQYEAIVRRMVDPGLLEYADYKTVRARIFPIPAHGTKKVELAYTQLLKGENGMVKYRFPLKAKIKQDPVEKIKVDVKLSSKRGLRTIWSPTHVIKANRSDNHLAKIAMIQKNALPDKDFLLYYSVSDKDLAANLVTHKRVNEKGYFLMTLSPPVKAKAVIGKDIVLVADTSGSMSGKKMKQNKKALKYVVNALNTSDHFGIVNFSTDAEAFKGQLVPANAENKKRALEFIDDLEARGGTNIGDAISVAKTVLGTQSKRPAYIILMTDGEPTVGERQTGKLVKLADSPRDIRLFDFGVGYDINTKLLNRLASSHHGTSQYVEPDENLETALSSFYDKIKSPVLSNVKIAYQGVDVKDIYPKNVTDIFAGSQVLLLGRYKAGAPATVQLTGEINGVKKAYSFPMKFSGNDASNSHLARLWAMRRIGYLTDVAQANGDTKEVVDEIVALSKKHGIITAYTSYLVTDPSENRRLPRPVRAAEVAARRTPRRSVGSFIRGRGPSLAVAPAAPMPVRAGAGSAATGAGTTVRGSMARSSGGRKVARRSLSRTRFYSAPRQLRILDNRPALADASIMTGSSRLAALPPPPPDFSLSYSSAAEMIYGDEGVSGLPADRKVIAVHRAKRANKLKTSNLLAYEKKEKNVSSRIKTVGEKTFYLRGGFWTDSWYIGKKTPVKTIKFGSREYFDLIRNNKGLARYLSVGKQVIVRFKGKVYKVVQPRPATS